MTDGHEDELVAECNVVQATILAACCGQTVIVRTRRGVLAYKEAVDLSEGVTRTVTVDFRFAQAPLASKEC